jgi:hypothetical protein
MQTATEYQIVQKKVMAVMGWNETEYANYIMECGYAYLRHYIPNETEAMIQCITHSRIFWNWWKLEWHARDTAFASHYYKLIKIDCAKEIYHNEHDPRTLAACIYPNGVVLEESYAIMIGKLNQQAVLQ